MLRMIALAGALLALAACSSTPPPPPPGPAAGFGPANGANGPVGTSSFAPGSQQDLAATAGDRVFFTFDNADISSDARQILQRQADWLQHYPNVTVTIQGNCDQRGTREYNLALGERRAEAVKQVLVASGISPQRIQTISFGKERPAVIGTSEADYAQNRRAVTVVN